MTIEDVFVVFLLFVKSRKEEEKEYQGRKQHLKLLPAAYNSSVFFSDEELEVCCGSTLYDFTCESKKRVEEDYKNLCNTLFYQHMNIFPLDKFSLEEVSFCKVYLFSLI